MPSLSSWWTTVWVLLVWTAGVVAIWLIAGVALNAGVTDEAVDECVEEGFIPAAQCEEALERLEADDPHSVSVGATLLIWILGCVVLLWVTRPRRPDPA